MLGCHKMLYPQIAGLFFLRFLFYVCVSVLHSKRYTSKHFHSSHLPFALLTLLQLSSPLSLTFFKKYIDFNHSILGRLLWFLMCRFPIANAIISKYFHFSQDRNGGLGAWVATNSGGNAAWGRKGIGGGELGNKKNRFGVWYGFAMQMQYFQYFPFLSFTFHPSHPITTIFLNSLSITSLTTSLIPIAPFRLLRVLMCTFSNDKRYTFKHFHSSHAPLTFPILLQSFSPLSVHLLSYFLDFNHSIIFGLLRFGRCGLPIANPILSQTFPLARMHRSPFSPNCTRSHLSLSLPFLPLLGLT